MKNSTIPSEHSLFTKSEVAREMKVTVRCLENWMRDRRITFVKCGRAVRFTRDAIDAFKQACTIDAQSEH